MLQGRECKAVHQIRMLKLLLLSRAIQQPAQPALGQHQATGNAVLYTMKNHA